MSPESEFRLSFYQDVAMLNQEHDVRLVAHIETGKQYVRKTLQHYDLRIMELLRKRSFPGIPRILEWIPADEGLIIIEDYIPGDSLAQILEKFLFSPQEAATVITNLCKILAPLHACLPPVIHRDIKASNVILSEGGALYLIDFDAAKYYDPSKNRDTVLIGTEDYAAPEQYGFGQSDKQTDIYALGILLNILVTGHIPGERLVDGPLQSVVVTCTQLDPNNRYQTVAELLTALQSAKEALCDTAQTAEPEPHTISLPEPPHRRLPWWRQITGFKSGKKLPATIAILWYFLVTYAAFTAETRDANGYLVRGFLSWSGNLFVWLLIILETLYLGNSFHIRDRFPYRKKEDGHFMLNVLRILLGVAIILFGLAFLSVLIDQVYVMVQAQK